MENQNIIENVKNKFPIEHAHLRYPGSYYPIKVETTVEKLMAFLPVEKWKDAGIEIGIDGSSASFVIDEFISIIDDHLEDMVGEPWVKIPEYKTFFEIIWPEIIKIRYDKNILWSKKLGQIENKKITLGIVGFYLATLKEFFDSWTNYDTTVGDSFVLDDLRDEISNAKTTDDYGYEMLAEIIRVSVENYNSI